MLTNIDVTFFFGGSVFTSLESIPRNGTAE